MGARPPGFSRASARSTTASRAPRRLRFSPAAHASSRRSLSLRSYRRTGKRGWKTGGTCAGSRARLSTSAPEPELEPAPEREPLPSPSWPGRLRSALPCPALPWPALAWPDPVIDRGALQPLLQRHRMNTEFLCDLLARDTGPMTTRNTHDVITELLKLERRDINVLPGHPSRQSNEGTQPRCHLLVQHTRSGIVSSVDACCVHASRDDLGCCGLQGDGLR